MTSYVYALVDPRDDEIRYIGITKREPSKRFNGHMNEARKDTHTRKRAWIRSLVTDGLSPTFTLVAAGDFTWEQLCVLEVAYIAQYTVDGYDLTNITEGGDGTNGYAAPRTDEWRAKLSAAVAEVNRREGRGSERQKQRVANIKAKNDGAYPGYTKGRTSPMKGRTLSEETRAKMREAHKARWARAKAEGRYEEICENIAAGTKRAMNKKETP